MIRRLLLACLLAAFIGATVTPAHAAKDVVQFGSTIKIAADASVHDAVCFFCNVDDEGAVDGDIVVFFGNVHIASKANHDVVTFFGHVNADDNATVGHDMVTLFGSVHLGQNVSIGKDMVAMFGGVHEASSAIVGGDRVVQPAWVFWGPILIFAFAFILIVREFRSYRRRQYMRGYPYPPVR